MNLPTSILSLLALTLCSIAPAAALAQDGGPLPFPVTVGGQAAVAKAGEPFAKIPSPVAADAAVEVAVNAPMTIINVTAYDVAKKEPVAGAATAIILLQGTPKGSLDKTMDSKKLAPGNYIMSVVADGKTDSVMLQVK